MHSPLQLRRLANRGSTARILARAKLQAVTLIQAEL